jgi:integrase
MDFERNTITLNKPEKFGNPRIFKVTNKLIAMLNALPRVHQRVFGSNLIAFRKSAFYQTRKVLVKEITNLLEVGFEYVCEKDRLIYFRKRK